MFAKERTRKIVDRCGADGISIYGGWKCADWSYSGNKASVGKTSLAAKLYSLTTGVTLEDLAFNSADGGKRWRFEYRDGRECVARTSCFRVWRSRQVPERNGTDGTLSSYTFTGSLDGNDANGDDGGAANGESCSAGDTTIGGKGGDIRGKPKRDNGRAESWWGQTGGVSGSGVVHKRLSGWEVGPAGDASSGAATNGSLPHWRPRQEAPLVSGRKRSRWWWWCRELRGLDKHAGAGSGGAGGAGGAGGGVERAEIRAWFDNFPRLSMVLQSSTLPTTYAGKGGKGAAGQSGESPGGKLGGDALSHRVLRGISAVLAETAAPVEAARAAYPLECSTRDPNNHRCGHNCGDRH